MSQIINLSQIPWQTRERTLATLGSGDNNHLKLPRVNLPTFAGLFDERIPFCSMFRNMIDQNAALLKAQKMQYLIALKGKAHDVIGSLEIADENYVKVWEILRDKYDVL